MKFPKSQFSTNAASGSKGSTSYDKRNPISSKYFQTTYNTENTCAYIVRPTSHDHLVEVINDLNSKGLTYSVVSTGANLGYGGKAPLASSDVLIDLFFLKGIEVDESRSVAIIEAGVTQQELFDYLVKHDIEYWFHVTGAPAETSIVGNAMAGGYANGVNGIRYDKIISVKGVFNDGTEFDTHRGSNTKYDDSPDIRGCFKGGEHGIITEVIYELDPIPELMQISFFSVDPHEDIASVMDSFEYFRKHNVVQSNISIFNSYRIYAENTGHCSEKILNNQVAFKQEIYKYLSDNGLDFWSGEYSGVIANTYTDKEVLEVTERYIENRLRKYITKFKSIEVTKEDILRLRKNTEARLPENALEGMRGRILTFTGMPKYGSVSMGYWRKGHVDINDMNLERDKCGFLWLALSLNPQSGNCLEIIQNLEKIVIESNLEPFYVVDYIRPHESYIMWSIIYDRENKDDDAIAEQCYNNCVSYIETNTDVSVYRKVRSFSKR